MSRHRPRYKKPVYPKQLTLLPKNEWPAEWAEVDFQKPIEIWVSRKFLAQIFDASSDEYHGLLRLSVNRTRYNSRGWKGDITWDELQQIKHDVGLGNCYAIEIYPQDTHVINIANIRHLWVLDKPFNIGWGYDKK